MVLFLYFFHDLKINLKLSFFPIPKREILFFLLIFFVLEILKVFVISKYWRREKTVSNMEKFMCSDEIGRL